MLAPLACTTPPPFHCSWRSTEVSPSSLTSQSLSTGSSCVLWAENSAATACAARVSCWLPVCVSPAGSQGRAPCEAQMCSGQKRVLTHCVSPAGSHQRGQFEGSDMVMADEGVPATAGSCLWLACRACHGCDQHQLQCTRRHGSGSSCQAWLLISCMWLACCDNAQTWGGQWSTKARRAAAGQAAGFLSCLHAAHTDADAEPHASEDCKKLSLHLSIHSDTGVHISGLTHLAV